MNVGWVSPPGRSGSRATAAMALRGVAVGVGALVAVAVGGNVAVAVGSTSMIGM